MDLLQPARAFCHACGRTVSEDGGDGGVVCLIVSGVDELGSRYNTHVAAVVAIGVFVVSTPLAVRFTVATMTTGATGPFEMRPTYGYTLLAVLVHYTYPCKSSLVRRVCEQNMHTFQVDKFGSRLSRLQVQRQHTYNQPNAGTTTLPTSRRSYDCLSRFANTMVCPVRLCLPTYWWNSVSC